MTHVPSAPQQRDGRAPHAATPAAATAPDVVELDLPADAAYLGVVRTACAGLGARLDLTLDEIEDLRIAVDEACTLVLRPGGRDDLADTTDAAPGPATGVRVTSRLRASFSVRDDTLAVRVVGPNPHLPDETSYAWAVLEALAGDVASGTGVGESWISLSHTRLRGA
ncbi:anti-sigma regulatory factor [Aquipuribacter nitratireducens]|uniref:Anti-sigma regulatory factor n=1 Tax=Aquipuribacter nitratireducens TaxID=650104 RepID=A0ABW0GRJ9_9MICO